jgi:hypothetical protein
MFWGDTAPHKITMDFISREEAQTWVNHATKGWCHYNKKYEEE